MGSRVFDGGDLACGELLLRLANWLVDVPAGTIVCIVATDFAAPIDIPAWCHLIGHRYLGEARQQDGRPGYDIEVSDRPRMSRPGRPWHLAADPYESSGG